MEFKAVIRMCFAIDHSPESSNFYSHVLLLISIVEPTLLWS